MQNKGCGIKVCRVPGSSCEGYSFGCRGFLQLLTFLLLCQLPLCSCSCLLLSLQTLLQLPHRLLILLFCLHGVMEPKTHMYNCYVFIWMHISRWTTISKHTHDAMMIFLTCSAAARCPGGAGWVQNARCVLTCPESPAGCAAPALSACSPAAQPSVSWHPAPACD